MRTKLVVGNWKMNFTLAEATAAVESFLKHIEARTNVDVAICPPLIINETELADLFGRLRQAMDAALAELKSEGHFKG